MVPDYTYPGQWFDDMGYSVLTLQHAPQLGVDLNSTPGLGRSDIKMLTQTLQGSGLDPYSEG
jgi:hypothetical protein